MVFLTEKESASILGVMDEEQQPSIRDRKERKKYIGDPRALLLLTVTMISMLPTRVRR